MPLDCSTHPIQHVLHQRGGPYALHGVDAVAFSISLSGFERDGFFPLAVLWYYRHLDAPAYPENTGHKIGTKFVAVTQPSLQSGFDVDSRKIRPDLIEITKRQDNNDPTSPIVLRARFQPSGMFRVVEGAMPDGTKAPARFYCAYAHL